MKSAKPADFDFEDYLAGAKSNLEDSRFKPLFRLFFKQVHGLTTHKAMAAQIGMTPSRLSQCLSDPNEFTIGTIRVILDQFPNPEHRRYLLRAYLWETLGEDFISDKEREDLAAGESQKEILLRLRMLKRQGRLRAARMLCERAASISEDVEFRFRMLYEAFALCETLAQYGYAHRIAVSFIRQAEALGDEYRQIFGHSMRYRVKARCPRFQIEGVARELEQLRQKFLLLPNVALGEKRILLPSEYYLWATQLTVLIAAAEQGYFKVSDSLSRRMHSEIEERLKRETDATNIRSLKFVRARLYGVDGQHAALVEALAEYAEEANPEFQSLRQLATLQALAKVEENDYEAMFSQLRQLYQTSMSFQDYSRARVAQLRIAELVERHFFEQDR